MSYLQTSKDWCVDTDTFEFFHIQTSKRLKSNPYYIRVPIYLWHWIGRDTSLYTWKKCDNHEELCVLEFRIKDWFLRFNANLTYFEVRFKTNNGDSSKLRVSPEITKSDIKDLVDNINYHIQLPNSDEIVSDVCIGSPKLRFDYIASLRSTISSNNQNYGLSFGMLPTQWNIMYKGKHIGESLAYILGSWAILVDDDLSFDSVVLLHQMGHGQLTVSNFLYTVNPYVVKVQMMLG